MLFAVLAGAAVFLTMAMFTSKSSMLGFPCALFWAILGGYCYQQSTVPWDIYFLTAFASLLGMTPFAMFAAYGLRTKKEDLAIGDEFIDEGKDDLKFFDEGGSGNGKTAETETEADGEQPSRRSRDIRDRANKRRTRWK